MNKMDLESKLFRYGMWWRIFYGSLRIAFGLFLFSVINESFSDLLYRFMSAELFEDPTDLLFYTVNSFLQTHPFIVTSFIAVYMIFWGFVDIFLSFNLLRHKIWTFPVSLYLIAFFVLYELYRFFYTYSYILLSVIVIDILIAWLIWREYKKTKLVF